MRNRFAWTAAGVALSAGMLWSAVMTSVATAAAVPPVVPGFNRLKDEGKASLEEQGQVLLGELNCTQCHTAPQAQRVFAKGTPDLSNAGARMTPQYLRKYILSPHEVKPGSTMPDLFHASAPAAKQGAVEFLTAYLVSLGGPIKPSTEDGNILAAERGRKLFHTIGCVACHAPEKGAATKVPSVALPNLAEKTTVDELEAFLTDPLKVRPASRMPNFGLNHDDARALAIYLLRDQLNNPQVAQGEVARISGIKYEYFEKKKMESAALSAFAKGKPKSSGALDHFTLRFPGHRDGNFGVKFRGIIAIPKNGKYTFYATSDDGSRIFIDNRQIVENDGIHPMGEKQGDIDLQAGDHEITVTYFQGGGEWDLKVEWSGPDVPRQEIPSSVLFHPGQRPMVPLNSENYSLDPQKAAMGQQMFAMIGCAMCHTIPGVKSMKTAKPLASLNVDADDGCLGTQIIKGRPQYDLSDDQRAALKAAIKDQSGLAKPLAPAEQVTHMMAAVNCFACHKRGGVGGPTPDRAEYFTMTAEFDMGEEGKIPPILTHAGGKLLPEAMEAIIHEGKLHIRPVLATRMPMWGKEPLKGLVDAFQKTDSTPETEAKAPEFSAAAAQDGRTMVGIKGAGCVNCHSVLGVKSLGMPAPDLTWTHDRVKYGWYRQWMDNPPAMIPGTRMPQFWVNHEATLKEVAGGTEEGQQNAIWAYLSMGQSMTLPIGLLPTGGFELVPGDQPLIHRTFMAGVGPRSILVGFPESVHIAFDANGVKLAEAWRGKFFDASGMWEGRGGRWNPPLGNDILLMPPGPAFALLESASSNWPELEMGRRDEKFRNVGGHFKGYELDKQERPIFHYILNDIDIHEQPMPMLKTAKAVLVRKFTVTGKQPKEALYFLAGEGQKIEPKGPGTWSIDDKQTVTLSTTAGMVLAPVIRESNGKKQLLLPVQLNIGSASFDVEISW
jgi:mono/diheme cytochrome c family protein